MSPLRGGGSLYDNISNDGIPMDALAELQDTGFEPQTRARSNTWPLPRPENFVEPETELDSSKCSNQQLASNPGKYSILLVLGCPFELQKKNSSKPNNTMCNATLLRRALFCLTIWSTVPTLFPIGAFQRT